MLSYQKQYELAQDLVRDTNTASTTFLQQQINIGQRDLESHIGTRFNLKTRPYTTVTSDTSYNLPENFIRLDNLYVTVQSRQYTAEQVFDEILWRKINADTQNTTSDYLANVFVRSKTFEIFPKFSTAGLTMTMRYEFLSKDMTADDYTTGTVTDLANAATTVTGSGTTWTSAMAGRYIRITSNGEWYEIDSVTSTTELELVRSYQGSTLSGASESYIIGEMPPTPGPTHHIPAYFAAWQFFSAFKRDTYWSKHYEKMYLGYRDWASTTFGKTYTSTYIPSQRRLLRKHINYNPNYYPDPLT